MSNSSGGDGSGAQGGDARGAPAEGAAARHDLILILDFGSQFTQLIARRIREQGVYCEIRPCTDAAPASLDQIEGGNLVGVVLSGGPSSVYDADAPPFDPKWLDVDVPILGVCYGMQLMAWHLGGQVVRADRREYGHATLQRHEGSPLLGGLSVRSVVWMSHGDHVDQAPPGWLTYGASDNTPIAAMGTADGRRAGLQFHPEVSHTAEGVEIIRAFLSDVCHARADWTMGHFVDEQVARLRARLGDDAVLCALSGGVDSSVTAALLRRAIGDRLICVFVDHGLNRKGERDAVEAEFSDFGVRVIDAQERFLGALAGVVDPEQKRKIIGESFIRVFEAEARRLRSERGDVRWLAQGTLYPDVIESLSFRGPSATIKSHHNVGGLPADMELQLVEPLRELFKDEVRALGLELGLSEERVYRHPFPGPGLAVRCLGDVTEQKLALIREADAILHEEVRAAGLYRAIWQMYVALLPVRSVGVMGDGRTYEQACVVRAVSSQDGMTATIVRLPWELLERVSTRIINEVRGINRVCYDISSKPPATIEWE